MNEGKEKFLSDVLSVEELKEYGNKVCIVSGVGSGKNRWIERKLTKYGTVLFITSRSAVKDEMLVNENEFISYFAAQREKGQCVVMTHALLYNLLRSCHEPIKLFAQTCHFDFIVIDEAHCLVSDGTFTDSVFHLWEFVESVNKETTVILMSATIPSIKGKITKMGYQIIDHSIDCKNVKPQKVRIISMEQAIKLLKFASKDNKVLYMSTSAKNMVKSTRQRLIDEGISAQKIACIMSDKRAEDLLNKGEIIKSGICYDNIVKRNVLPKDIEILLTTSKLKEGINVKDVDVKTVFIETHNMIDIKQFSGRMRFGVDTLYIIDDAKQNRNNAKYEELDFDFSRKIIAVVNDYLEPLKVDAFGLFQQIYEEKNYNLNLYKDKHIREFIDYIEEKFEFIRFSHFDNCFKIYQQRKAGYDDHKWDIENYKQNKISLLKETIGIDDVKDIVITKEMIQTEVHKYIEKEKLLNSLVDKTQRDKILDQLTALGVRTSGNKPYKQLNSLLKKFKYGIIIIGDSNNGIYKIIKLDI